MNQLLSHVSAMIKWNLKLKTITFTLAALKMKYLDINLKICTSYK